MRKIYLVLFLSVALVFMFRKNTEYPILLPNGERAIFVASKLPFANYDWEDENVIQVYKTLDEKNWSYYSAFNPDIYRPKSFTRIDTVFFDGEYHQMAYAEFIPEPRK